MTPFERALHIKLLAGLLLIWTAALAALFGVLLATRDIVTLHGDTKDTSKLFGAEKCEQRPLADCSGGWTCNDGTISVVCHP